MISSFYFANKTQTDNISCIKSQTINSSYGAYELTPCSLSMPSNRLHEFFHVTS